MKAKLRQQLLDLDPVALLRDIRTAQQRLSELSSGEAPIPSEGMGPTTVSTFLASLATARKDGEVRPTHRKKPSKERWWRTRSDSFEHAWPVVEAWLLAEPTVTAKELLARLAQMIPAHTLAVLSFVRCNGG